MIYTTESLILLQLLLHFVMDFSAACTRSPALHSRLAVMAPAQFANSVCISCIFCRATINQAEIYINKFKKKNRLASCSQCVSRHTLQLLTKLPHAPIISQVAIGLFKLALAQHRSRWQKCNQRCLTTLQGCQWKLWRTRRKWSQSGPLPSCFSDKLAAALPWCCDPNYRSWIKSVFQPGCSICSCSQCCKKNPKVIPEYKFWILYFYLTMCHL